MRIEFENCVFYLCLAAVLITLIFAFAEDNAQDQQLLHECVAVQMATPAECQALYGDDE